MKTVLHLALAAFCVIALTGQTFAQLELGQPKKSPAATPLPPPALPTPKSAIEKFASHLSLIKQGMAVTPRHKQVLVSGLNAISEGAVKPAEKSINELTENLVKTAVLKPFSQEASAKLTATIKIILNSSSISQPELETALKNAEAILSADGAQNAGAKLVLKDLKNIAGELHKAPVDSRKIVPPKDSGKRLF